MKNKEEYRLLCQTEPSICVYDQPWWMDAVCGAENWDVLLYKKGNEIAGAMPYYIKKRAGLHYITQPPFTQHNGIWIKYPEYQSEAKRLSMEKEIIYALIGQLEDLPICFYQQNFSPTLTNWQPFYWKGFSQVTNYTYRLPDISDINLVFSGMQPNKRKSIRKAMGGQFEVKFDLPKDIFYDLHQQSLMKQNQKIHYSRDFFYRMHDAAYNNGCGQTIYITKSGEKVPICALFDIWDQNWGYNLINAINPDFRGSGAPDLMLFSMIKHLSGKVSGFDFEGSMIEKNEDSIRRFGGEQTPYFKIYKTYTKNPLARAAICYKLK